MEFVDLVLGEGIDADDLGELGAEGISDACHSAADGGFGDSKGGGDVLAAAASRTRIE